jgi:hypothetical protein
MLIVLVVAGCESANCSCTLSRVGKGARLVSSASMLSVPTKTSSNVVAVAAAVAVLGFS